MNPPKTTETQTARAYAAGTRAERAHREVMAALPSAPSLDDIRIASPSWNDKLLPITAAIADAVSDMEVYEAIVDHVAKAVGARSVALWLLDDDGVTVQRVRFRSEAAARLLQDDAALAEEGAAPPPPVLEAIRRGEAVWIQSLADAGNRSPPRVALTDGQVKTRMSCLPLVARNRPVGALALVMDEAAATRVEPATHEHRCEQQFLLLVARYASQAIERLHLYQESVCARSRAEELYRFAEAVAAAERIDTVFDAALAAMDPALGAKRASILTIGKDGVMRFRAWRNLPDEYRSAVEGHSPWAADVATAPAPLLIPDVEHDPANAAYLPVFRQHNIRALAFIPLFAGKLLGKFMVYYDQPHAFSPHEIEMARAIANQLTSVIIRFAVRDELEERMSELASTDRRKDEFLATLAHELRNPLAPLRNSLELLRLGENDPTVIQRVRGIMDRQLGHLVRLVDDLLDVARITSGKLQLRRERVTLRSLVETAVEASRPQIDKAGQTLTISMSDDRILLDADPTRLAQVLSNLLTNASKYTDAGGRIRLSAERDGDTVTIRVCDNGLGIPTDHLPRIFEMFSQVTPALERTQGGLGIGLALVKGIVGLHDGTVSATSEGPGRGSTFTVRLPMGGAAAAARTVAPPLAAVGPGHRILIVDDNTDSADTLAAILRLGGNEVQTAYEGTAALTAVQSFRPHAMLLDLGMAPMNGYEVCRRIREQPWGGSLVVVAMTGWGQDDDRRRTQQAGFDAHLVKPIDSTALVRLFAELIPTAAG